MIILGLLISQCILLERGNMMMPVERIEYNNELLAIIIRSDYDKNGIDFLTPGDFSQQMAYMHHPSGHVIQPHYHNRVERSVYYTQETLVIKEGKLQVDFYDEEQHKINETVLCAGDVILLCKGGHGFSVIEEVKMIEIKQGPYAGDNDKTRFVPK